MVQDRIMSDMISFMDLERPRATPVLADWGLGCPGSLCKTPYEPLPEASLKHLTHKTVFLLALASAWRCSELQALVFDSKYLQFKSQVYGVRLYFSPEFKHKNQQLSQTNDPQFIPAFSTGKSGEFGFPNCLWELFSTIIGS